MAPRAGDGKLLVVGGYGEVGRVVSRTLAPIFPNRVAIAGRNRTRAEAVARSIGYGTEGRRFDIAADSAAPYDTSLVVMCVDQTDARFVERCLSAGIDYVDVTAKQSSIDAFEKLDAVAKKSGSKAVLSVGVAPGVTNLLAAHAARQFDAVTEVDLFLMIGPGDVHGAAAVDWTLDNLGAKFDVVQDGSRHQVESFVDHEDVAFSRWSRPRRAYRFNFPDQRTVARTLHIPTVSTWLCFDSLMLNGLMHALAKWRHSGRSLRPPVRRAVARATRAFRYGSDKCVVLARARGQVNGQTLVCEFSVAGRRESRLTGLMAADTARMILTGQGSPGVLHLEQFAADPKEMLERLQRAAPETRLSL